MERERLASAGVENGTGMATQCHNVQLQGRETDRCAIVIVLYMDGWIDTRVVSAGRAPASHGMGRNNAGACTKQSSLETVARTLSRLADEPVRGLVF